MVRKPLKIIYLNKFTGGTLEGAIDRIKHINSIGTFNAINKVRISNGFLTEKEKKK